MIPIGPLSCDAPTVVCGVKSACNVPDDSLGAFIDLVDRIRVHQGHCGFPRINTNISLRAVLGQGLRESWFFGRQGHFAGHSVVKNGQLDRIVGMILDLIHNGLIAVKMFAVKGHNLIFWADTSHGRRAVGKHLFDDERFHRRPRCRSGAVCCAARRRAVPTLGVIFKSPASGPRAAPPREWWDSVLVHDAPHHRITYAAEACDRMIIDGKDFIADLQASFSGGHIRRHVADDGGGFGFADRFADNPDETGENQGQPKAEKRSGESDDDFLAGPAAGGSSSRGVSLLPSTASIGAICGSAT